MFVACGIWCLADVSSVSPSSEQTDQTHISLQLTTDQRLASKAAPYSLRGPLPVTKESRRLLWRTKNGLHATVYTFWIVLLPQACLNLNFFPIFMMTDP